MCIYYFQLNWLEVTRQKRIEGASWKSALSPWANEQALAFHHSLTRSTTRNWYAISKTNQLYSPIRFSLFQMLTAVLLERYFCIILYHL